MTADNIVEFRRRRRALLCAICGCSFLTRTAEPHCPACEREIERVARQIRETLEYAAHVAGFGSFAALAAAYLAFEGATEERP